MSDCRVLITGADGFVGRALQHRTARADLAVRAAARSNSKGYCAVGEIDGRTRWSEALSGVSEVVHLAARVHVMRDRTSDPLAEFRRVNVAGTLNLARQAVDAGVRRLVYLSSIKVNGEATEPGVPFTPDDRPEPLGAYAVSKYEAEIALLRLAETTSMEVVIVRPVLVYGPGVKGNFRSLMRVLSRGIPLPLAGLKNQRSFVSVGNLVELLLCCLREPGAANQVFLVSDGEDLSTTELMERLALALGRPARSFRVPVTVLRAAGRLLGKADVVQRMSGSLQVDISKSRQMLGWTPEIRVDEALCETVKAYLDRC